MDTNINGVRDDNERRVAGSTVSVTLSNGAVLSALTDGSGQYVIADVPYGEYPVGVVYKGDALTITKRINVAGTQVDLDIPVTVAGETLALTGSNTSQEAQTALMFIGAGLVLLLATRRRRRSDPNIE